MTFLGRVLSSWGVLQKHSTYFWGNTKNLRIFWSPKYRLLWLFWGAYCFFGLHCFSGCTVFLWPHYFSGAHFLGLYATVEHIVKLTSSKEVLFIFNRIFLHLVKESRVYLCTFVLFDQSCKFIDSLSCNIMLFIAREIFSSNSLISGLWSPLRSEELRSFKSQISNLY